MPKENDSMTPPPSNTELPHENETRGLHPIETDRPRTDATSPGPVSRDTASFSMDVPADTGAAAAPSPANSLPQELINHPRYRMQERLGAGGMGIVYKAWHRVMHRWVALKVVRSELVDRPEMLARFEREVRAAAHLLHPNIVTAYDAETCGYFHFLVMEYVAGTNLSRLIAEKGALPVACACDYARQAALGLQHAFERGMVHRDIKPHNLMLLLASEGKEPPAAAGNGESCPSLAGVVKILDFGLARFVQETHPSSGESSVSDLVLGPRARTQERDDQETPATLIGTVPGSQMGTLDYMAPEQAEDPRRADIRADIYSLGCTLYALLTGGPPFAGVLEHRKAEAHQGRVPRPASASRPDVPAALEQVLARMMAKDPTRRFQTPAEVAEALTPFTTLPAGPGRKRATWRVRAVVLALGLLLGALLGVAGVAAHRHFFPTPPPGEDHEAGPQEGHVDAVPIVTAPERRFEGHTLPVSGVTYSRDGGLLLSGSYDGTLRSWDAETGRPLRVFCGHTGKVRGVALSADGRLALSGGEDGTARVWDVNSGRQVNELIGHRHTVTCVAFSPDGRLALTGSEKDEPIRVWDVATAEQVGEFPCSAESVAFSPDGHRVASGGWDQPVHLWDVSSGQELRAFPGRTEQVKSVAFSPDGKRIVSGSEDWTLALWDVASGTLVHHWPAHKGYIWDVAFSPDGQRILSASWDRTARLWDVASGKELQRFEPDAEQILCVAFSHDGRSAVCGCADKVIRQWRLP